MNVIPFLPEHFTAMRLQDRQARTLSALTLEYVHVLKASGPALSGEVDGKIIACCGIASQFSGVGTMWAVISEDAGRHFIRLHKCGVRLLSIPKLRRIEATSETSFTQGCRWLELLGFQSEGVMRSYGPHGEDHVRYART